MMAESNARKRNLPSWMSSREEESNDTEKPKQPRNHAESNNAFQDFSTLMEGVVFALSGFVNPERGALRSQMLEMGAEYQPDWNSDCTLLVCAFSNTPKFRQVKADGGTIISKDWISECYNQRKLVDLEPFLMHAGKPWRKHSISHESKEDIKPSISSKSLKQEETSSSSKKTTNSSKLRGCFSPSKVKKWAVEDLKRTISWLESQDEKPEPSEIKKIAAEGIITCLQDAIDALKQKGQGIQNIAEQWACLPRVVEELAQCDANRGDSPSPSKEDLWREAMACKQIYELEFLNMEHDFIVDEKKAPTGGGKKAEVKEINAGDNCSYDSDETIEMTEEEIDRAYNTISCS